MSTKKISPESIATNVQFLEKLSQLIALESLEELTRDLAECQSLINSHPLLYEHPKAKGSLVDSLHEIELVLRLLKPTDE